MLRGPGSSLLLVHCPAPLSGSLVWVPDPWPLVPSPSPGAWSQVLGPGLGLSHGSRTPRLRILRKPRNPRNPPDHRATRRNAAT